MNDPALPTQINLLQEQVASLRQALEESRRENTILRQKLDALARRFFGKKSEQLNAAQMELLLSGLVDSAVSDEKKEPPARPAPRTARSSSQRLRTPDHLEVVRQVIEPELVQAEPGDTTAHSYGLAVDVGTTTGVAQMVDLNTGRTVDVEEFSRREFTSK